MEMVASTIRIRITGILYDASINPPAPLRNRTIRIRYDLESEDITTTTTGSDGSFSVEVEVDEGTQELFVVFRGGKTYSRSFVVLQLQQSGGEEVTLE